MFRQLRQPCIEIVDSVQAEGKAEQVFTAPARQLRKELLKALQQIKFAQHHIHRQACAQVPRQFIHPCAKHVSASLARFGALHQQGLYIDHQHHPIQGAAAAIAPQPVQQVQPQARVSVRRQYRPDFTFGRHRFLRLLGALFLRQGLRLREQLTRRVDQDGFVADPPVDGIRQFFFRLRAGPRPVDMGQGKALI